MSEGPMTTERKPLPIPCQGCGAAIEHTKTHCRYCKGEASGRRSYEFRKSEPHGASDVDPATLAILWVASRASKRTQPPLVSRRDPGEAEK